MHHQNIIFDQTENPPSEKINELRMALRAFNQAQIGTQDYSDILITASNQTGELAGGVYGKIAWQWLYVDLLWVDEDFRGQNLGSRLLSDIEKAANKHGIFNYYLSTASFQAPDFYQKMGYKIFGQIEGLPPGQTTYFLKKSDQ